MNGRVVEGLTKLADDQGLRRWVDTWPIPPPSTAEPLEYFITIRGADARPSTLAGPKYRRFHQLYSLLRDASRVPFCGPLPCVAAP